MATNKTTSKVAAKSAETASIKNTALTLELGTRDDGQAPRTLFPLVLADSATLLRAAKGSMSGNTYVGFQFAQAGSGWATGVPALTARCDVVVEDEYDISVESGRVYAKEFISNDKPRYAKYLCDETEIEVYWRNVGGAVIATLNVGHGDQLPKRTNCTWVEGDRLPTPEIPGTDPTRGISSTPIIGNASWYYVLTAEGILRTGRKPIPTCTSATLQYIIQGEEM